MSRTTEEIIQDDIEYLPDTGELFWKRSSRGRKLSKPIGCTNTKGYRVVTLGGTQFKLHRVVWFKVYGEWPEGELDHIDKNKDNNKVENLRVGSSINSHNRSMPLPRSGLIGACWNKARQKYKTAIRIDGKNIHLGYFDTPEEASSVYLKAKERVLNG